MSTNIATSLATTYLHHSLPAPPLPPSKRIYRIAIQTASPYAPWSCGTRAILIALSLPLGNTRQDKIHTNTITRRQCLTFHQSILHWLIMGTPSSLWNLTCINTNITREDPIRIYEQYTACGLMQASSLPKGTSPPPHHQHNNISPLSQHDNISPTISANKPDDIQSNHPV